MAILDNLKQIRYRMRAAAERAGKDPDSITLVAVTKYATLEAVKELLESGQAAQLGESRVQDAAAKQQALGPLAKKASWRLIGHLQTNKAKKALEIFDAIDSVDSLKIAQALERDLAAQDRKRPVLVQVKLTDKETQAGVAPESVEELLKNLENLPHLEVQGLMAIAPMVEPVEATRPYFKGMRALFDRLFKDRPQARLSMGMSRDFEVAIEEGATMVRIGSQIFS